MLEEEALAIEGRQSGRDRGGTQGGYAGGSLGDANGMHERSVLPMGAQDDGFLLSFTFLRVRSPSQLPRSPPAPPAGSAARGRPMRTASAVPSVWAVPVSPEESDAEEPPASESSEFDDRFFRSRCRRFWNQT